MGANLNDRVAAVARPGETIDGEAVDQAATVALTGDVTEAQPLRAHTPAGAATSLGGVTDKIAYARALAESGLLPEQYRRQPGNLLWAIEFAEMLGVHPMQAITGVHVIEGKPSASADLMAARVRAAGHRLRITGDDTAATATLIRRDDPDYPFTATFTVDDADRAGLTVPTRSGKPSNWMKYPRAMCRARAVTEVCRMGASEVLMGVIYTPEELGADVDADGQPVRVQSWQPPPAGDTAAMGEAPEAAEWAQRVADVTTADDGRALWKEAGAARDLVHDGQSIADRIMARVAVLTTDEATGPEQQPPRPDPVPGGPHPNGGTWPTLPDPEPPADQAVIPSGDYMDEAAAGMANAARNRAEPDNWMAPAYNEPTPQPKPATMPDDPELRRDTPARRAVLTVLTEHHIGDEQSRARYDLPLAEVATNRLREWTFEISKAENEKRRADSA